MDEKNNTITSYKKLIVWQKAMQLVFVIYRLTDNYPKNELFCLTNQIRRAAIAVPSNIAEGNRRGTRRDYRHFLLIAFGSGAELETQLAIGRNLNYGNLQDYHPIENLLSEVMRMLNRMIKSLQD